MNSLSLQLLQISLWHSIRGTILLWVNTPQSREAHSPCSGGGHPSYCQTDSSTVPESVFRRELKPAAQGKAQYPHPGTHCPAFSIM